MFQVRKKHKDLTSKTNKKSENITLMLVAVVSVFIVCVIPDLILRIILTLMNYIPGKQLFVLDTTCACSTLCCTLNQLMAIRISGKDMPYSNPLKTEWLMVACVIADFLCSGHFVTNFVSQLSMVAQCVYGYHV